MSLSDRLPPTTRGDGVRGALLSGTRVAGIVAAVLAVLAGCSAGPGVSKRPLGAARPTTTARPSAPGTPLPTSTGSSSPSSALAQGSPAASFTPAGPGGPSPLVPLVTPPLPGEGVWKADTGALVGGGAAIYATELRPAAGVAAAGVAWIKSGASRISLYAGTSEPNGRWPQQGAVASAQQPSLLAAFNSGFKIYSYRTGWYDQGVTAMALQPGAASLVIFADGTATVADWGRDVSMGPNVTSVRQNLTLLVDNGIVAANLADTSYWGAVLHGGAQTWRSGIGVTGSGDLVYVGGSGLDPTYLAELLVAAGARRAMELDINPQWVSFAVFAHAGGQVGQPLTTATNLLPSMYYHPAHYLQPFSRDFLAVFAR